MAISETTAQLSATQASYERREQEWRLQYQLAESELATSRQQIELAKAHWEVVQQEQSISTTQQDPGPGNPGLSGPKFPMPSCTSG
jgi:sulfur relay (sulfurtransferase) DsrC/TusE family protein